MMKKTDQARHQARGVSLIEVIISMLILSAGVLAYTQSHSNQIAAGLDNLERQQAALIASDINNMIAAHVNQAGSTTKAQTTTLINALKKQLLAQATTIAKQRGYACKNYTPQIQGGSPSNTTTTSTALEPWIHGPAFCLKIEIPANQVVDPLFNGVWVQTTVYWLPLKRSDNSTDNISISSLISPS